MKQVLFGCLICPLDGLTLVQNEKSAICANNHNFDFDRKGTINLLPVQFKKSKNPGDSKEMVIARRNFLDSGAYQPICDCLNSLVKKYSKDDMAILDAGCGEGYYTNALTKYLEQENSDNIFSIAGLDISKEAIHEAAKRNRNILWITGTNAKPPVSDQSLDIIICLFGFPVWPEFKRILKPGGVVIMADPGPDHLIELRRVLYPEIKEKNAEEIILDDFDLIEQSHLNETINLPGTASIADLLTMTPHGYRATQEKRDEALQTEFKTMTLDVVFRIYG